MNFESVFKETNVASAVRLAREKSANKMAKEEFTLTRRQIVDLIGDDQPMVNSAIATLYMRGALKGVGNTEMFVSLMCGPRTLKILQALLAFGSFLGIEEKIRYNRRCAEMILKRVDLSELNKLKLGVRAKMEEEINVVDDPVEIILAAEEVEKKIRQETQKINDLIRHYKFLQNWVSVSKEHVKDAGGKKVKAEEAKPESGFAGHKAETNQNQASDRQILVPQLISRKTPATKRNPLEILVELENQVKANRIKTEKMKIQAPAGKPVGKPESPEAGEASGEQEVRVIFDDLVKRVADERARKNVKRLEYLVVEGKIPLEIAVEKAKVFVKKEV